MSSNKSQGSGRRGWKIAAGVLVGLFALAGIAYGVDVVMAQGKVPRGTTVGGVSIGGMDPEQAKATLERELGDTVNEPVTVTAGEMSSTLVPAQSGLSINWDATLAGIGTESWNPLTRLAPLFGVTFEAGIASDVVEEELGPQIDRVTAELNREPSDGVVALIDATVAVTDPINGQYVEWEKVFNEVTSEWLNPEGVEVEAQINPPSIGDKQVKDAAEGPATAAVASPLTVLGREEITAVIEPARMGEVLSFVAEGAQLRPEVNLEAAQNILSEQLAASERTRQNAKIAFTGGGRSVTPSVDGVKINWDTTLEGFQERVVGAAEGRTWEAIYEDDPATFTTEMAQTATFDQVVGEFSTSGYSAASGVNIAKVAATVNGAIVAPGDTFSLNGYTGPRGAAQGYVESGIIINGRAGEAVGGGISQFATTLYNAAYFAGMEDVAHTAHSYYISRYPAGREATVFEGAIDLKFRNNSQYPVRIDTAVGGGSVTVRLTGVKTVSVESVNGGRWAPTQPREQKISGSDCIPSGGIPGFTTSDTRIIRDLAGNEISRETQTTVYDPQPIVRCTGN